MTVHKMHFCINGKKPGGFWLCNWTSQAQLASCQHSPEHLAEGQWTHPYEMCHKGSVSPCLSLVSSLNTLLLLEGQLSWPAAGCFDLMPVFLMSESDTCNFERVLFEIDNKIFSRYGLFDFEYTHQCQGTTEASKKEKLFLMSWCPDRYE